MQYKIPKEVLKVLESLVADGYEAYLVGGCVRDLLLGAIHGELVEPDDWDITTNAIPEEIQKVFPDSFYENDFGTVGVKTGSEDSAIKIVEITPYRIEAKYTDKRHPDILKFSKKLKDDLERRDFTVNAMAMRVDPVVTDVVNEDLVEIVDLHGGKKDLEEKIIRTVGSPKERFNEDALRILRAVRLAAKLGFKIEPGTEKMVKEEAHLLNAISMERIRDEFSKIIMSDNPRFGIQEIQKLGIMKLIMPEMEQGIGVGQNKEHIYTVWEHCLKSLQHAADKKFSLEVRMAAFLHDIGKPKTKEGEGVDSTFYNHEWVGSRMAVKALSRLRYSKKFIEKVGRLVRWHLFFSDTEVITLSAVRRVVRNVGPENIWDLMNVRFCDRIGMGRPKEEPYRLRKYESMIEEAMRDPLTVGALKIDGAGVMKMANIKPGPKVGFILHALLEEVLDDPELNTKEYLEKRTKEMVKMTDEEVEKLGQSGKERKAKEEEKEVTEIRKKYHVR